MEDCELCGRPTETVYVLNIENVEMRTCAKCAKGKKVIRTESYAEPKKAKMQATSARPRQVSDDDKVLIEDYGFTVRRAREKMHLPIKVLAEMLNEKEHLLVRVEEQKTKPTIELTKKLEKALRIKLTEDAVEESRAYTNKVSESATIGDFVGK